MIPLFFLPRQITRALDPIGAGSLDSAFDGVGRILTHLSAHAPFTLSPVESRICASKGFEVDSRLSENVKVKFEGDDVFIAFVVDGEQKIYKLHQTLFECLVEASHTYVKANIASIADLLLWELDRTIEELRTHLGSAPIQNQEKLMNKLNNLHGWLGCWLGWVIAYDKKRTGGSSHETIMEEDTCLYKRIQGTFPVFFGTLPLISANINALHEFFSVSFNPTPANGNLSGKARSRLEEIRKTSLLPLQTLRCKLLKQIEALLLTTKEEEAMSALIDAPIHLFFRLQPFRASFFQEYNQRFLSFRVTRRSYIGFSGAEFEIQKKSLRWAVDHLGRSSKDHLQSIFTLIKTHKNLRADLEICQNKISQLEADPEIFPDICREFGINPLIPSTGKPLSVDQLADKLRSAGHDLSMEMGRYEMLIFQAIDWMLFKNNKAFQINICDLLSFMSWSQLLKYSEFGEHNIPPHFAGKSRYFLEQLALHYAAMPALDACDGEKLIDEGKAFFYKATFSTERGNTNLNLGDFAGLLFAFDNYLTINSWVGEVRALLKSNLHAINDDPSHFSYEEMAKLNHFLEENKLLEPLKIAEHLLDDFYRILLIDDIPKEMTAQFWINSVEAQLESRRPRLEPIVEDETTLFFTRTSIPDTVISLSEGLEVVATTATRPIESLTTETAPSEATVASSSDELEALPEERIPTKAVPSEDFDAKGDDALSSLLTESIRLVHQERERSLAKRNLQTRRLHRLEESKDELTSALPAVGVTGIQKLDPQLLRQLRDPRKFQKYIAQAGLNLLSEGRSHRGLSDGKTEVRVPRHPGKDISPGVRHKVLKTLSTRTTDSTE